MADKFEAVATDWVNGVTNINQTMSKTSERTLICHEWNIGFQALDGSFWVSILRHSVTTKRCVLAARRVLRREGYVMIGVEIDHEHWVDWSSAEARNVIIPAPTSPLADPEWHLKRSTKLGRPDIEWRDMIMSERKKRMARV